MLNPLSNVVGQRVHVTMTSTISSKITYVFVAWVGVNSRWGSIISISLFDWGSIRIFVGWGSNQDWGSIRADTVSKHNFNCIVKELRKHLFFQKSKLLGRTEK